jgi:hypothetical protein
MSANTGASRLEGLVDPLASPKGIANSLGNYWQCSTNVGIVEWEMLKKILWVHFILCLEMFSLVTRRGKICWKKLSSNRKQIDPSGL